MFTSLFLILVSSSHYLGFCLSFSADTRQSFSVTPPSLLFPLAYPRPGSKDCFLVLEHSSRDQGGAPESSGPFYGNSLDWPILFPVIYFLSTLCQMLDAGHTTKNQDRPGPLLLGARILFIVEEIET